MLIYKMAIFLCGFKVTGILGRAIEISKCPLASCSLSHTHTPHRTQKTLENTLFVEGLHSYLFFPNDRGSHAAKAAAPT